MALKLNIGHLNGAAAVMERFDFLFGIMLGEMLLKHSNNLSKTLQKEKLYLQQRDKSVL